MSSSLILLIARILLSFMFIMSGIQKLGTIADTAGYISSVGLPAPVALAWAAGLFEIIAGTAVLLGLFTRVAAWALIAFCLFTGFVFHLDPSNQMQIINLTKNLTIVGGFLALIAAGPGSISVDARRS